MGSGGDPQARLAQEPAPGGPGWFAPGNDFANYRGQPLWQNPYEPRTPLDWARAEYAQFGRGPDPAQDYSGTLALAQQEMPGDKKDYDKWIQARTDINKMFFGEFPNTPYWAKFITPPEGLPASPFSLPAFPTPPSPNVAEGSGDAPGAFGDTDTGGTGMSGTDTGSGSGAVGTGPGLA